MRKPHWWALAALVGTLGMVLALASPALSQRPQPPLSVPAHIQKATKLQKRDIDKVLTALGPAVNAQLQLGNSVSIEGLGVFRVVSIPAHRDLINGRPATVPASNYVEFLPSAGLVAAANAGGSTPAETVPPFEFRPLPGQTKSPHVGSSRAPNNRTR